MHQLARQADARTLSLLAVAALVVLALFLLTIAQVARRRPKLRNSFLALGGTLVLCSGLALALVELRLP
jgi:hypothetical protein